MTDSMINRVNDARAEIGALPIVANDGGASKRSAQTLAAPQTAEVSRGPEGAVRIGPVWTEGAVDVFQDVVSPGGSMAEHAGQCGLLVMIRSGNGAFTMKAGDGTEDALICGPGDLVLVEAGAMHGFRNAGETPLAFVGIQVAAGGA